MAKTIYCLEDDIDILDMVTYALRTSGFESIGFTDASSFEAKMQEFLPDLFQGCTAVRAELFNVGKIHQDFFHLKTGKLFLHRGLALAGFSRLFLCGFLFFFRQSFRDAGTDRGFACSALTGQDRKHFAQPSSPPCP